MKSKNNRDSDDFKIRQENVASQLECRLLTERDLPQVNQFIEKYYTTRVPIRDIFKVTKADVGDRDRVRAAIKIKDNASFGIFRKDNGRLVSMSLNSIHDKAAAEVKPTDGKITAGTPNYERVLRFARHVEGDLFRALNTTNFMNLGMGVTDPKYGGLRLRSFFKIPELEDAIAREAGCEYVVAATVSHFSQRRMEENPDFVMLKEVKYADYVDPLTGEKPDLALSPIHTCIRLYYKPLKPKTLRSKL